MPEIFSPEFSTPFFFRDLSIVVMRDILQSRYLRRRVAHKQLARTSLSTASSNKRKNGHMTGRNRLHWLKCKNICVETTIKAPPTLNNCKLLLVIIICFYVRVFVNRLKLYVKILVSLQNQFQK